eukprot:1024058-Pelagomonas_calceolata.AAC.1
MPCCVGRHAQNCEPTGCGEHRCTIAGNKARTTLSADNVEGLHFVCLRVAHSWVWEVAIAYIYAR